MVALPQNRLVKVVHEFDLGERVDEPGGVQRGASSGSGGHGWPIAGEARDDPECLLLLRLDTSRCDCSDARLHG